MSRYANRSGTSGVTFFHIHKDGIEVTFHDGNTYLYTYASAGHDHVEKMKKLAEAGLGLATYINQHTRDLYARKW